MGLAPACTAKGSHVVLEQCGSRTMKMMVAIIFGEKVLLCEYENLNGQILGGVDSKIEKAKSLDVGLDSDPSQNNALVRTALSKIGPSPIQSRTFFIL